MSRFQEVVAKPDFPAMERETLAWWTQEGIMQAYLKRNEGAAERYVHRRPNHGEQPDGRPPRLGPHLQGSLPALPDDARQASSAIRTVSTARVSGSRSKSRKSSGSRANETSKSLASLNSSSDASSASCTFAERITEQSIRLGYWMDWDNSYLHDVGREQLHHLALPEDSARTRLDVQGPRVMPWCPRCGTGISEHEIVTEGYQERTHLALYVAFPLRR